MTIVGNAVFGLLIGLLLLVLFSFLGMSIDSLLTGSLIIGAVAFSIYAVLGQSRLSKPYWISPTFSAIPIAAVAATEITASALTFCVCTVTVLVAGVAGAYVGAMRRCNNKSERPRF
jgi:hypothetical protein